MTVPMSIFEEAGGFSPHEPMGVEDIDNLEGVRIGSSPASKAASAAIEETWQAMSPGAVSPPPPAPPARTGLATDLRVQPPPVVDRRRLEAQAAAAQQVAKAAAYVPPALQPVVDQVPSLAPIVQTATQATMPPSLAQRGARVIVLIDVDGRGVILQ